ncbi:MAG: NAD(P) transhydrogenase subunit alpha [Chloroflexota bacterium]
MLTSILLHLALFAPLAQTEGSTTTGTGLPTLFLIIVVFILAVFLGIEIISKVPTMLHTPLMSGTNAIHGIVLVGAMIVLGAAGDNLLLIILGFIGVVFGAGNVVGGFVVTDRMLQMFKKKPQPGGKK